MNWPASLAVRDPANPPSMWDAMTIQVVRMAARHTPTELSAGSRKNGLHLPEMGGALHDCGSPSAVFGQRP